MNKISVYTEIPALQSKAMHLAKELGIPYSTEKNSSEYLLLLTPDYIGIQKTADFGAPLIIDFLSPRLTYRRKHATVRKEMLARALGLKKHSATKILDLTVGLARDSFILAALGFEIEMFERSAIIQVLLVDGMQRAARDQELALIMARMHLNKTDAKHVLLESHLAEVIYLDPMFPARVKSALVKKDMRIFHDIVGDDADAGQLLTLALACSAKRVVVKRPRTANYLSELKPSLSMEGSSSRFDIYLP